MSAEIASPIVSFVCLWIILVGYLGGVEIGKIPTSIIAMGVGTALA